MKDSIQRVKSIATVHELLSVEQTESTDIQQLAERLLRMAAQNIASPGQQITRIVDGDELRLASKQATALALVLSELFNNALLHGLADRSAGQIGVYICTTNGQVTLTVQDDGAGLPSDFCWEADEHLGLRIVRTLVQRELRGEASLEDLESGAVATVIFPRPAEHGTWNR